MWYIYVIDKWYHTIPDSRPVRRFLPVQESVGRVQSSGTAKDLWKKPVAIILPLFHQFNKFKLFL
jgi:hypothetical protein